MKSFRKLADRECPNCKTVFRPPRNSARYCCQRCRWDNNGGKNRKIATWWINSRGYIEGRIVGPDGVKRRVKKHRWVMECHLGRRLSPAELVHHKNENKKDNRISNLEIKSNSEHTSYHNGKRIYKKGYKMKLSKQERSRRSKAAKAMKLDELGRAAIAKATGGEQ